MQGSLDISRVARFETFELNLKTGELRRGGVKIRLQEQSFQILAALLERPGKLVTREALHERLWPDGTFVDFEDGLNSAVRRLRRALGDSADEPRLIETLPQRGYRFIGPVELVDSEGKVVGLPEAAGAEHAISHFRLLEKLGEGGMGVVYKALDTNLNRTVGLKFLAPRLTQDPEAKKRFRREAEAAAAVDHPNICTVYEVNEVDGQIFIAMAYIEGPSLDKKIGGSPLPLEEAFDIAAQTVQGLQAAHEKGVVHRDIKSANILLTAGGQVKIVDFGLAQLASPDQLTKTGTTLGTPAYRSPEQARWEKLDRRTDIWSLGVVLYEMVRGQLPFRGEVEQAVMHAILHADPDPLTAVRTGVPIELDYLVDKALAKERDERYQHVDDVLVDLRKLHKEQPSDVERQRTTPGTTRPAPRGRRKKSTKAWLAAAAAVVLAVAGAAFWNFRPTTTEAPREPMRPVPLTTYPGAEPSVHFPPTAIKWPSRGPPTQDEPEGGACFQHKMSLKAITATTAGQGTLRGNVDYHAACRTSHADPDAAVSRSRRHAQLRRDRPQAGLRADRTYPTRLPIPRSVQEGQRHRAPLPRSADSAARRIAASAASSSSRRRFPPATRPTISLCCPSRRRARRPLGPRHPSHSRTRVQSLRQDRIPTISRDLGRTRAYREHHVHHTKTRAAAVSIGERRKPDPGGRPGYLPTRCIKATPIPARDCITSMPSTRSRNGRWWAVAKPSPRPICSRF